MSFALLGQLMRGSPISTFVGIVGLPITSAASPQGVPVFVLWPCMMISCHVPGGRALEVGRTLLQLHRSGCG